MSQQSFQEQVETVSSVRSSSLFPLKKSEQTHSTFHRSRSSRRSRSPNRSSRHARSPKRHHHQSPRKPHSSQYRRTSPSRPKRRNSSSCSRNRLQESQRPTNIPPSSDSWRNPQPFVSPWKVTISPGTAPPSTSESWRTVADHSVHVEATQQSDPPRNTKKGHVFFVLAHGLNFVCECPPTTYANLLNGQGSLKINECTRKNTQAFASCPLPSLIYSFIILHVAKSPDLAAATSFLRAALSNEMPMEQLWSLYTAVFPQLRNKAPTDLHTVKALLQLRS